VGSYTFSDVVTDHTIAATFAIDTVAVDIPDPSLQAAVRAALAKPTGTITDLDMRSCTFLAASGAGIQDLTGLQYATNLTFLNLTNNQITDLTPVANLTGLNTLYVGGNRITDLTPLVAGGVPNSTLVVAGNRLDLTVGSADRTAISAVAACGCYVIYDSQQMLSLVPSSTAHGAISPASAQYVYYHTSKTFTITPDTGAHIVDVTIDGVSVGAVGSYTFSDVVANHTIRAAFAIDTHTVTASAGAHGEISPATTQTVEYGSDSPTFTIMCSIA
jgi:hypothetical protein